MATAACCSYTAPLEIDPVCAKVSLLDVVSGFGGLGIRVQGFRVY